MTAVNDRGSSGACGCGAEVGASACGPAAFGAAAARAGAFPGQYKRFNFTEECNQVMAFSLEFEYGGHRNR